MPHLVLLYTPDLEQEADIPGLCRALADTMLEQRDENAKAVFPTGGTRVLAYPAAHSAVADGQGDYGFLYANLRMGAGRSAAVHKAVGDSLLAVLRTRLGKILEHRPVGITLQIDESQSQVYDGKQSSLHPLFNKNSLRFTMLDSTFIQQAAARLDAAERSRQQVRQFSLDHPQITIEDAYAIQRAWVAQKIKDGRKLVGHKIGLTSRAMQVSSNITEPDYGALLDDMFFDEGTDIPFERFIVPRVEVELAFILGKPLKGPNVTVFDVLDATEWVIPALEIIDARIQQVDPDTKVTRKVFDTISDNAANAGVVMGGRAVRPTEIDLRKVPAVLYRNGVIEESGVSAAVLNHPAKGVAWLANKLAPYGVTLEPGQIILGGSFTRPVAANPGDTFHVDYDMLGSIACRFV